MDIPFFLQAYEKQSQVDETEKYLYQNHVQTKQSVAKLRNRRDGRSCITY
jgi:hypothetical protein